MNATEIEAKIGYVFSNKDLLKTAFTHSSYAALHGTESNERLEFLGDAVIELVESERQYRKTSSSEGVMTKERVKRVMDGALEPIVTRLGLEEYILYEGKRTENLGKKAIPSLMEALVAAVFLDGGYEAAKAFVSDKLALLEKSDGQEEVYEDWISKLKERLEKTGKSLTKEDWAVTKTGKDNDPTFTVSLQFSGITATGQGKTKKQAQKIAARNMLEELERTDK